MLALIVIIGLMLSMSAPALAGEVYHLKGNGVNAYWYEYDISTGVYTEINVSGQESVYNGSPGRPQAKTYVGIQVHQYRYEGYEYIPLSNVSYWGYVPTECLIIDKNLAAVSLIVEGLEGWKWDYITEKSTVVSLDVDVSWTATGPLSRNSYRWHYRSSMSMVNYRYQGKNRQATAQGSVCYDGVSKILGASSWASIFSAREGQVVVNRK